MPELPEVQNVVMSLEPKLIGRKIVSVEINFENKLSDKALTKMLRKQSPEEFIERAVGCEIKDVSRRAKYIIINLEKQGVPYVIVGHLGMAGGMFGTKTINDVIEKFRKHIHIKMILDDSSYFTFSDIRRFGGMTIYTEEEFKNLKTVHSLGPEPFWDNAEEIFLQNIKKKLYKNQTIESNGEKKNIKYGIPIKEAIMDQNVVAGVGNIYACESLWHTKVNPFTPVANLSDEKLREIFRSFRDLMAFSISVGGTSVSDYVNGEGMMGSFQNYLKVYNQKKCSSCGTEILKMDEFNGRKIRTTHFCPTCQEFHSNMV